MKETNEGLRRHKLLTEDLRKQLPKLYATENTPTDEKIAVVKFFCPYSGLRWYAVEFDGTDTFFGLVEGWETEWGYFSLGELAAVTTQNGVPAVERDLYYSPKAIKDIQTVGA
jgi:hypothetical protein